MARSVSTPSNTVYTEYCSFDGDSDDFEFYRDDLQSALCRAFPSVSKCNEWVGREDRAIAENSFAYFGVSEYCGLVAIWCAAKEPGYYENAGFEGLRDRWLNQIAGKFSKATRGSFGQALVQTGRFSNGEGFLQAIEGQNQGAMGLGYSSKEGWL